MLGFFSFKEYGVSCFGTCRDRDKTDFLVPWFTALFHYEQGKEDL